MTSVLPVLSSLYSQRITIIKFFSVSLLGGGIDAACGLFCLNYLGMDLYLSASVGFFVGLVAGYVLHQIWTFSETTKRARANFFRFCMAYVLLLLIRYIIVAALLQLHMLFGISGMAYVESISYIVMLGLSFVCNYLICKYFVFR